MLEKSRELEMKNSIIEKQQLVQNFNYCYSNLQNQQLLNLKLNQYIRRLQESIQQLGLEKDQLTTEIESLKNKNKKLEQENKKLNNQLDEKEEQLKKSKQSLEIQEKKSQKLENDYKEQIQLELNEKNSEITSIKLQLSKLENEKQKLQTELNQKEFEIQNKVLGASKKDGEINQLDKVCNDYRNKIQQLQEERTNLENQINLLQKTVLEKQQECNTLRIQFDQQKSEYQRLEKQFDDETSRQTELLQGEKRRFIQMTQDYDNQVRDLQEKFNREHKAKIKEMEQRYESQLRNIEKNHQEQISLLNTQHYELENQKNVFLEQLLSQGATLLQKENELKGLQNQATVIVYQYRIQRLVEYQNREYNSDMKFSIEAIIEDKTCKFDDWIKKQNEQLQFELIQIKLDKKVKETLYNVSDLNYAQCATQFPMGIMKGTKCLVPLPNEESIDKYYLFKCSECPQKKDFVGKYFGIKEWKKPDIKDAFAIETAISNYLATLIASEFMKQYILELKNANVSNIFEPQFREQFLILSTKCFRVFFKEELDRVQLVNRNEGFQFYCDFIQTLSDENSNDFFETIRQFKLKNLLKEQKDKKSIIADENEMIEYFINQTVEPQTTKLKGIYYQANKEQIRKQFSSLMTFIGEQQNEMPIKIYQTIQQIEVLPDFVKFNGGRMFFNETQYGKFLSAFTYFSIIRSEHQLCISHLQGYQNILYDPLVSTFDGFLDHQDQGNNEIRTLESKFLSTAHAKKGVEYARALVMVWK